MCEPTVRDSWASPLPKGGQTPERKASGELHGFWCNATRWPRARVPAHAHHWHACANVRVPAWEVLPEIGCKAPEEVPSTVSDAPLDQPVQEWKGRGRMVVQLSWGKLNLQFRITMWETNNCKDLLPSGRILLQLRFSVNCKSCAQQ